MGHDGHAGHDDHDAIVDAAKTEVKIVAWKGASLPTQSEVEARLHQEGYESFRWYDVPGAAYPKHRHSADECIWVLQGEITFKVGNESYALKAGDRIYLPAHTPHTAEVPKIAGVTYLVGQKV